MTGKTPNLDLPYIAPAQAQKHVTHNEAIRALDALIQLSIIGVENSPPDSQQDGARYIVGSEPSGDFLGHANELAAFQDGAWAFFMPQIGWQAYHQDQAGLFVFDGSEWKAISGEGADMTARLGINAAADDINRLVVQSDAALFNHDGGGHQVKINKAEQGDTASLVYQTGFAGHAEMGLTGSNNFALNVSADGASFLNAMQVDNVTGDVSFGAGVNRERLLPTLPESGSGAEFYGFPNLITTSTSQTVFSLLSGRLYFGAVYVDRPTRITGGLLALSKGSTSPDALMRLGIFDIGVPNGDKWQVGGLRADFGAQAATEAGGLDYTLEQPVLLEPAWYMFAAGVSGADAQLRCLQNYTPGLTQYKLTGSGGSTLFRVVGPSAYCFLSNQGDSIRDGFPADWGDQLMNDAANSAFRCLTFFVPKFRHWNAP